MRKQITTKDTKDHKGRCTAGDAGVRRGNKLYPRDQKERGEWVELLFMAEAARRGLKVARPHGDSARFDVIVEGGGKLRRVQVKSTLFNRNGCYECLCFWSRVGARRVSKQYTEKQIDFVAAYVVPEDTWFVIPARDLRTKTLYLPTRERAPRSKYGKYLEAWEQLGMERERLTIFAAEDEMGLVIEMIKEKLVALESGPHDGTKAFTTKETEEHRTIAARDAGKRQDP